MPEARTSLCILAMNLSAFTNSKMAHIPDMEKEHSNPDLVGYTANTDMPDFHFRRIGTTSTANKFAQVSVNFNLESITKVI